MKLGYYKWIKLVKIVAEWDREGHQFLQQYRASGGAPEKPVRPEPCGCGSAECDAVYKQQMEHYPAQLASYEKQLKKYNSLVAKNNGKPPALPEPDPLPESYPLLVLRLKAMIVNDKHKKALIQRCEGEIKYCHERGVSKEGDSDGKHSYEDVVALQELLEIAEKAELGVEFELT